MDQINRVLRSEMEPRQPIRKLLSRWFMPGWTGSMLAVMVGLSAVLMPFTVAQDKIPSLEYRVKAAFLLNFTKFIEWPAPAAGSAAFTICILGDDPFDGALDRIVQGESVNGRKLIVERVSREEPHTCQMVFADRAEKDLSQVLSHLGPGVLTVGEGDAFLHQGGMIAFIIENRHVRFDINLAAATNAALKFSSKLLSVARTVEK